MRRFTPGIHSRGIERIDGAACALPALFSFAGLVIDAQIKHKEVQNND